MRATEERLPRLLGTWSAAAVVIGMIIGSGIFRVPAQVAEHVPSAGAGLLLWVFGGAIALAGGLVVAELATMMPRPGGIYVYLHETYGALPAFLFGWTEFLIIRPGTIAATGMISAGYLGAFVPLSEAGQRNMAVLLALVLAAAHYRSTLLGAAVQNASSLVKAAALVVLALLLLAFGDGSAGALAGAGGGGAITAGGVAIALVAVLWAYDGWADLATMAGEVRDPARVLPRALVGGLGAIIAIYLLINVAYLYILPLGEVAASRLVAADAAARVLGPVGASLVAALVMIATFGTANATMMTGPRVVFAMANDGLFFRRLAAVHPRYGTPHLAIAATGALGVLYAGSRSFEQLTAAIVLGSWPFYTLAVAAVLVLRRREPQRERPFRTPFVPLLPLLFVLGSLVLMASALLVDPVPTLLSFAIIGSGIPAYLLWLRPGVRRGS